MFNFFKKKKNAKTIEQAAVFEQFVRGVWQSLIEMNELDCADWTQLQNVSNLCILAWNCSLMECSPEEAKQTVPSKLHDFFQSNDTSLVEFVCQTMDFKYQYFSEHLFLILESKVSLVAGLPQITVFIDEE